MAAREDRDGGARSLHDPHAGPCRSARRSLFRAQSSDTQARCGQGSRDASRWLTRSTHLRNCRIELVLEGRDALDDGIEGRSEEHTSELQSLMRNSYAVFCLKNKKNEHTNMTSQNIKTTKKKNRK